MVGDRDAAGSVASQRGAERVLDAKALVGFAGVISFTVAANLMLKIGAAAPPAERVFFGVLGWKSAAGLALFGCGGILYAVLLRSISLNLAQVFAASQFVGVVLAAGWVLGEPISMARWVGIAFVSLGILLVGLTAQA
jgi:drug/metabolite transporter (DMT)-like permease